jgi:hypothetical protein
MQSLHELTTQLRQSDVPDKKEIYVLLLELFLSVEDGKCADDVDMRRLLVNFEPFASSVLVADLSNDAEGDSHGIILQIIALCFSNMQQWEKDSTPCLNSLIVAVCHVILNVELCLFTRESRELDEELVITSLFSLDNSMPAIALEQQVLLIKTFNHVLQSSNENNLIRIYGYRALRTFTVDFMQISSTAVIKDVLTALSVPFMADLIHTDLAMREATLEYLECLPLKSVRILSAYSDEDMRNVLRFLRSVDDLIPALFLLCCSLNASDILIPLQTTHT